MTFEVLEDFCVWDVHKSPIRQTCDVGQDIIKEVPMAASFL